MPTVAGLADLAVGPESGCPREGFKKRQEVDPAWPTVRAHNAAEPDVHLDGRRCINIRSVHCPQGSAKGS